MANRQIGWSQESNLLWQIGNQVDRFEKVIFATLGSFVPTTRTLTINGTAYDLSADRSWTVSGGGTTIYSGDGTLSGNRVVTMGSYTLSFEKSLIINGLTVGRGAGNVATNTVFGYQALNSNTSVGLHTAIGYQALFSKTIYNAETAIGYQSMYSNVDGVYNVAVGYRSMYSNISAQQNTAIGWDALYSTTTGFGNNTAIGYNALRANINGGSNTAIGADSMPLLNSGSNNTAVGYNSLRNFTNGSNNDAFGKDSMSVFISGNYNAAFGRASLLAFTLGEFNTAIGVSALITTTTASNNTAIGFAAGYNLSGANGNTTGSNNIFIGSYCGGESSTESNRTWIGNTDTTSTWVGGNLLVGIRTNAGYKLDVNGTARVSGTGTFVTTDGATVLNLNQFTTATNAPLLNLNYNQTGGAGGGIFTIISSSGTRYLANFNNSSYIAANGSFVIGVAAYYGTNVLTTNGEIKINSSATNSITSSNGGLYASTGGGTDGISINFTSATNSSGISILNTFSGGTGSGSCYTLDNRGNNRHLYFHNNNTNPTVLTNAGNLLLGTTIDISSAKLNISSTTQGFLPPRMTNAQRIAIATPAVGLMVYCTDAVEGLYIYKSTGWTFVI